MDLQIALAERMKRIRLIVLDVDGVLTDGGIYMGPEGEAMKRFDIKDGLGIALWHRVGGKTAILTGRSSQIVENRAKELHISVVRQGCTDKGVAYKELKAELKISDEEIAYIGDDIIDLPVMKQVGLPVAVADAVPEVRSVACLVAAHCGGRGAIRETVERILRAQGRFEEAAAQYLLS
ncbi:MAG: HAD-IIIA family hydrolase [Schwartzia sp.]|nr:HAD-IIIA family hydrolase [Schwartzia sp. (in: firmicutes)]